MNFKKIIALSGHEEMRDGGQDCEVICVKVPRATRAQAYTGLLNVWRLFALLLRAASVVLSLSAHQSRASINSLRCCSCRGLKVYRPRRSKLAFYD